MWAFEEIKREREGANDSKVIQTFSKGGHKEELPNIVKTIHFISDISTPY